MPVRTLALPALVATALLTLCSCNPTTPAAPPADPANAAAPAAAALTGTQDPTSDPTSDPTADPAAAQAVTLVVPADATPATGADARTTGTGSPASASAKSPTAEPSASAPSARPVVAGNPNLALASYDKQTGKAVLAVTATAPTARPTATPTARPTATASAPAAAPAPATPAVHPGELIDSPPSAAAPHGALLAITGVQPADHGKVEVSTRPATISELLGRTWADVRTALDPRSIKVTPQVKDLKVSYVPKPDGGSGSASAALELDANNSIPLPDGSSAKFSGALRLDPAVDFSYQGGLLGLQKAKVGFDLGAHADWHVTAGLTAAGGPVRIPIATLAASPVVMVGQLPVVVSLNLAVYAEISADGTVTVDAAQTVDGNWAIHADYTKAGGWTSATEPVTTTVSPVRARFAGKADVRTALVADGSVALYDTLGVKATVEPYLRAAVDGKVSIDTSGAAPTVDGTAGLYGGLDVNGAVMARIAILGTPLFEKDLPFEIYRHEWPIVTRTAGAAPAH
ncbi:hypothetical protein GCM10009760_28070 [Kitasatospora kazusensis]|uniref:Lipoprotein n=1 Tax=Kitasatospora kazusensis TaxID=407974 RepID=A0ABN2ZIE4_9ACTN